ncbi:DUF2877 domain-containing protein [Clostridiaceae bacterium UIB06]|uniref:DUF2877 domain-containing protein n=1 Tax=Clostridium thailandense TaxID=2794346 RepID=A0A949WPL2_9CLOT|nr:DUF2877 domain-containing protein [Clostridium thailandense]MBV7271400.1 DUF2877 domain-containing protein [Clostridium thailandense]MCH5136142.1 DUF2877 domain-containing protein [Clostridiaceae bacterium UIB06]
MKAVAICDMLSSRIDTGLVVKAKVHSVFRNACNLVTDQNEFITILNSDKNICPMSVVIGEKESVDFAKLGISQGIDVILHKKRICSTRKELYVDFSNAKKWNSEPDLNFRPIDSISIEKNIKILERGINTYGRFSFIAPLLVFLGESHQSFNINIKYKEILEEKYKFITERFHGFIDSVIQNNLKEISSSAKKLIGFGIGLTPSMDDFMSGLMISLIYLTKYYGFEISQAYNLNSGIIKYGLNGTTRVSSEMLTFSAVGKSSQLVKSLILDLLCENEDYKILQKVKGVIDIGSTSGTDTLLGIYVGFKIINNIQFRN